MIGFWGSPTANRLASQADVILAVGTRFPETDSSSWEHGVTFAHPSDAPHPRRHRSARARPQLSDRTSPRRPMRRSRLRRHRRRLRRGDARARLRLGAASRASASSFWRRAARTPRRPSSRCCPSGSWPTCDARHPDAILVTDVGWNKNGVGQQYPVDSCDSFLTPGGFSTMGFGPAAVLGVAAAGHRTDRPSRWSATAPSARTRASSRRPWRWASPPSGS